jgi:CoA:oxalate CoA-transferase
MGTALAGLRILDLSRILLGPYATMILADLGADVIKIEMPVRGDDARHFGPYVNDESIYFMSLNRNKRSMTLNLKKEAGKKLLLELVKKVDVLVENFRPGTMDKLGLGYDVLKELNPQLIYAAASGFGQSGPYSKRPAYDAVVQAMGGLMSITSPDEDGSPTRTGASLGDITAGMFTAIGILAAVANRARTGLGQMVDVGMLDCQVALVENALIRYGVTGEIPKPVGNRHPLIAPFEPFDTQDGKIILAAGNDNLWAIFCKTVGLEELIDDPSYKTNPLRSENYSSLRPLIAEKLKTRKTAKWREIFDAAGIPNGPINTIDKVFEDPQVLSREMIAEVEHPAAGNVKMAGIPIKLSETPGSIRTAAPLLGQHTDEILREVLGYRDAEIKKLYGEGIF